MDRVGVLAICYGSRGAALVDTLRNSEEYNVELYVVDRQNNPLNAEVAKVHWVLPNLDVDEICRCASKYRNALDFCIVGPEAPILDGIREKLEERCKLTALCPTSDYALEGSKARQRVLLDEYAPDLNPRYKIFTPPMKDVAEKFKKWVDELGGIENTVIKPDKPGFGKGVGVGGEHFYTLEDGFKHFSSIFDGGGSVVVEEKVEGEESSYQALCDGKTLTILPETRDYKRAFDGDVGPNTGGMGAYRGGEKWLPFLTEIEWSYEVEKVEEVFKRIKGRGRNPSLLGVPFYIAFIHTGKGLKILEINSRPGDPEILCILPTLNGDLVEACFKMLDGNLSGLSFDRKAGVAIYAVPLTYGGYRSKYSGSMKVDLKGAYILKERYRRCLSIYPGAMELRGKETYALTSRTVVMVGVDDELEEARKIALDGITHVDGPLWNRMDIGSSRHVKQSIEHMRALRYDS